MNHSPTNDRDRTRLHIDSAITRLQAALNCIAPVFDSLEESEEDALSPEARPETEGRSSGGISDPTAGAAQRIGPFTERRKAILRAARALNDPIDHMLTEFERGLSRRVEIPTTCPELIEVSDGYGTTWVGCGQITGTNRGASRSDRLCDTHGSEYDANERRAKDALRNRRKRNAA